MRLYFFLSTAASSARQRLMPPSSSPAASPVRRPIRFALVAAMVWIPPFVNVTGLFGQVATPSALDKNDVSASIYEDKIKPLLADRCYACHGADKQEGGLRVDTGAWLRQGGDSGPAIDSTEWDRSPLWQRITAESADERMPPENEGEPLNAAERDTFKSWIVSGAHSPVDERAEVHWREHWSFQPIQRPAVPVVSPEYEIANPIDAFLADAQSHVGISPQPTAPREVLVRRLYLDLIGLPPTADEWKKARTDPSPDWYEQLARNLLTDSRHGQRWARHWMDIWRYSDWWGLGDQLRNSQKPIWHWRDWIVQSVNEDLPYDEMVRQMLAADELYPNDLQKVRATGYLARNYFLFNRNQWMDETVEHVSKGFLGLTINCAKCHDHKYDPLSQAEYYQLRAFFEPYHVRLDATPESPDLANAGIPRAYDGELNTPTYLFIRGQETNPDRTKSLEPLVPAALRFDEFAIAPVELPIEAWQPERRAWVVAQRRDEATARLRQAQTELQTVSSDATTSDPERIKVAERSVEAAEAHLASIEARIAATDALWKQQDHPSPEHQALADERARRAVLAERAETIAKARLDVQYSEHQVVLAKPEEREARDKALATARSALELALKKQEEDVHGEFTRFVGASWTPTRFMDSTKDDPAVGFPATSSGRRTALAKWITDPRNPLTARVAVNHIWTRHLGKPLVPTVFDFGRKGTPPTNQPLLDWLATELIESGWSVRHVHELIVNSSVYRRSSSVAGAARAMAIDPENHLWWRREPIRLEAEVVRDSLLALGHSLDTTLDGPPVLPADQPQSRRRSLYFFHSNNERNLFLSTFDEAMVKECYRREQSIIPQQALALTNSALVLDQLQPIADALSAPDNDLNDSAYVERALGLLLGIQPSPAERAACEEAIAAWRALPQADRSLARRLLVWTLINHNDFVTLR